MYFLADINILQNPENRMNSLARNHSRAVTSYSHSSSFLHPNDISALALKEFWLRKSVFNPPQGLAEAFAARRHLPGVDVPKVQIVHCSTRWLLLQTPQAKNKFFEYLSSGKLGCREEQLLKLFKNFVGLIRSYGFFRPTEKMIFLQRWQLRVWIHQDIFSNNPMMPIVNSCQGQKNFVISFLALVETSLRDWQRVSNVTTIEQTVRMLEWRCKLAKGCPTAVRASQQVHFKSNESVASFAPSQLVNANNIMSSQQFEYPPTLNKVKQGLSSSYTLYEDQLANKVKSIKMGKNSVEVKTSDREEEGQIRQTTKKFALNSTSSTLGKFSENWRSTVGRKKLLQKVQVQDQQPPPQPPAQVQSIQMEFEGLFADQGRNMGSQYDEAQLQRIAEEIEEVLIW